MLKFLVTGIGGDVAQGISKVIREKFADAIIVGCDLGEKHAGHLFVDTFRVVPRASANGYVSSIKALVIEFQVDILIPTSEPEIEVLSGAFTSDFGCKILTPGAKVVGNCLDKLKTNRFLKSIGLDVPWTVNANESLPRNYPCIFKGMKGAGSKLLFVVADEEEAKYLAWRHPQTIFQELLLPDESEVTCAVYRTGSGLISVLQLQRSLAGGATSWAKVIFEPEIDRVCRLVAEELDLVGSMNIQLRLTSDGPRIFEINPRFSSTVYMRNLIGYTDVIWSINDVLGVEVHFSEIPLDIELVRVFDSKILVGQKNKVK